MRLYDIELTFHDNLFYETRTLGRLYETGRLLHNIALCYALGYSLGSGFAQTTYHHALDRPHYKQELAPLNDSGIYVTPAKDIQVEYAVHTFKYGEEQNSVRMERSNKNLPTYGRAKEITVGSRFRFGVLSDNRLNFPEWIRMGIWMSKARLAITEIELTQVEADEKTVSHYPINPRDLSKGTELKVFDLMSMRPSSLVENALIKADNWWHAIHPDTEQHFYLPVGMSHTI